MNAHWNAAVRLRCPACGHGRLYAQLFDMHPACLACGQTFVMGDGDFVGGVYLNYGVVAIISFILFAMMEQAGTYTVGQEVGYLMTFVVLFPLLTVRHTRAFFLATVYSTGTLPRPPGDHRPAP